MKLSRLLSHEDFPVFEKPSLEQFSFNVGSSQFHMMLRRMQRDQGVISGDEMALAERVVGPTLLCSHQRVLFNPFTGEFRREGLI